MASISPILILILLHSSLAIETLHPLDYAALASIPTTLRDSPSSHFFASWNFNSTHPCTFPGVSCSGDRVISLSLGDPRASSSGLTGRLHPAIGRLSALTHLSLVPGRVYGSIPSTLSQLKRLRFLGISRNFISGEIPENLGQLKNLQTLDLSFNRLTGTIPPSIGKLPALSNLVLSHNRLTGSIPSFASDKLLRLDLNHNNLSDPLPYRGLPPSLQYLSLSSNHLSGSVNWALQRLNRLNYLDVSMNQFSGPIPAALFRFQIISLQLQRNRFSGPIRPVNQVMIPTVDLSYNSLSGEISPLLSGVGKLYLNNNRFTGRVPGSLVEGVVEGRIGLLYLQHNYLTGMEIDPRVEIPVRTTVCVQYNCMVVGLTTACPVNAGTVKVRPISQCEEWKGR